MSSCLSGGGRTYGFDLEIVKSPSTSTQTLVTTTSSSSPSSTISESSNSPLTISTRKPRTPRKRPNQTYNEAAALLSTAYPNVFSTKHFSKNPCKFTKPQDNFFDESSELLLPFRVINDDLGIIIPFHHHQLEKPSFRFETKSSNSIEKSCQSPIEIDSHSNFGDGYQYNHHHRHQQQQQQQHHHQDDDFDAESILDEEIEEGGIDSIMGNLSVNNDSSSSIDESNASSYYPMGLGFGGNFEFGFGIRLGVRAFRPVVDEGDWWRFPAIDVREISPKFNTTTTTKVSVKKKKKKVEKSLSELPKENSILAGKPPSNSELLAEKPIPKPDSAGLLLKLNYDKVLNAWSDRGSPFSDDIQGSELPGTGDAHARLAQIDLFPENGGAREACVLRYKEKRRTRLFSKKIRYQVRKVNADRRPRMKGRFVRRPNSNGSSLMKGSCNTN